MSMQTKTPVEQAKQNQSQVQHKPIQYFQSPLEDNRPEFAAQLQMQSLMANSPHASQLRSSQAMMTSSTPVMVNPLTVQCLKNREPLQAMAEEAEQYEQVKANVTDPTSQNAASTEPPKTSNTGLPSQLKAGIENLSGMSMDQVEVHYNSDKPAQLHAHAYAQGNEIYVAPGQERHLPHEAWHVVQQAQGRVQPTLQLRDAGAINNDAGLEAEADVMGGKAASLGFDSTSNRQLKQIFFDGSKSVCQLKYDRLTVLDGKYVSIVDLAKKQQGIVIELMIPFGQIEVAYEKIAQLAGQDNSPLNVAISIGLNCKESEKNAELNVNSGAQKLIEFATSQNVLCAVAPMVWREPEKSKGGYVFPFIEAHYKLGQHVGTLILREAMSHYCESVFHRTMDADVSQDPLLGPSISKDEDGEAQALRLGKRDISHAGIANVLANPENIGKIITGGYNWQTDDIETSDPVLAKIISLVNVMENWLRVSIEESESNLSGSLYAPEPNTYIPIYLKDQWDRGLQDGLTDKDSYDTQMGEHTHGRRAIMSMSTGIHYEGGVATTKPRKKWLDNFEGLAEAIRKADIEQAKVEFLKLKTEIHQSFLNPEVPAKIAKMQGVSLDGGQLKQLRLLSQEALQALWQTFRSNFKL